MSSIPINMLDLIPSINNAVLNSYKLVCDDETKTIGEITSRLPLDVLYNSVLDYVLNNLRINRTFTVTNVSQGQYNHGDVILPTHLIPDIIQKMLQFGGLVTFTPPSVTLSTSVNASPYAPSSSITTTFTITTTQGDSGGFTSVVLRKDLVPYYTLYSGPAVPGNTYTYTTTFTITANTEWDVLAVTHPGPPTLPDGLGNPVPNPHSIIEYKQSNKITYTVGFRLIYGYYLPTAIGPTDPANVVDSTMLTGLQTSLTPIGDYYGDIYTGINPGDVITIPITGVVPAGYRAIVFAVESPRTISMAKFVGDDNNMLLGPDYQKTVFYTAHGKNYNVYWLPQASGTLSTDPKLQLTIA